jgi:hypothetical protein
MTYNPITDIRLVEIREQLHLGNNIYEDKLLGFRIEYRRQGRYKESDWKSATTIKEYINDRKDNPLTPSL